MGPQAGCGNSATTHGTSTCVISDYERRVAERTAINISRDSLLREEGYCFCILMLSAILSIVRVAERALQPARKRH